MIPLHTKIKFGVDVVVCIIGLVRYRKARKDTRLLALWFALSVFTSILEYYFAVHRLNNLWINHIFTPVEYALLAWIFSLWQKDPRGQFALRLSAILFAALCLTSILFLDNVRMFNNLTRPVEGVLLVCFSGLTLRDLSRKYIESLTSQPEFWISSATLIYFSGLVVLYCLSNTLLGSSLEALRSAWIAHTIIGIIANLLYGVSFLCPQIR
jgi:hypothetical protein